MSLDLLHLHKSQHERYLNDLAKKLTDLAGEVFNIMADKGLNVSECSQFVHNVLPQLFDGKKEVALSKKQFSEIITIDKP